MFVFKSNLNSSQPEKDKLIFIVHFCLISNFYETGSRILKPILISCNSKKNLQANTVVFYNAFNVLKIKTVITSKYMSIKNNCQ